MQMFTPVSSELWLEEPRTQVVAGIGGKALGLSSIAAARLPCPAALVISTDAYRQALHDSHVDGLLDLTEEGHIAMSLIRREFESLDLRAEFITALGKAVSHLTSPFAVRSSAVIEDSPTASWAGHFLTLLGVQTSGLARSVVRCWSSVFTEPVATYAATNGLDLRQIYMAVIVQQMINPAWAGVLFTGIDLKRKRNPNTVLFEAVRGLGEKLVSGIVGPELRGEALLSDFSVRSIEINPISSGHRTQLVERPNTLPEAVISELAKGAAILQEVHGREFLDIEWAWDGQVTWFLQARTLVSQLFGGVATRLANHVRFLSIQVSPRSDTS